MPNLQFLGATDALVSISALDTLQKYFVVRNSAVASRLKSRLTTRLSDGLTAYFISSFCNILVRAARNVGAYGRTWDRCSCNATDVIGTPCKKVPTYIAFVYGLKQTLWRRPLGKCSYFRVTGYVNGLKW